MIENEFFRNENKYHITNGGVEYIVRAHSMRVNTTLVSAGQMKKLINTNKRCIDGRKGEIYRNI
jgi:hypothetical protein